MPVFSNQKPSIIVKTVTRFPANIVSSEGVKLEKGDNTYVFSLDYPNLSPASEISIPSKYTVAVYNRDKGIYEEVRLDNIPPKDAVDVKTSVGNTNYTIASGHYYIALTANLTTTRTWTLPAASTVSGGNRVRIQDEIGGVTNTNNIVIVPHSGDTINGLSSYTLNTQYSGIDLVSNGTNGWTRVEGQRGLDGADGKVPWQPPVAWAQSTAYTSTIPSSCVTYQGGTYVCSTSHTSSSTFDVSKWTIISDPGNALAAQAAATAAASSATSANTSYLAANTSAGEAATSAAAALSSKGSAETAATNAAASATTATTKATEAAASASAASGSASTATIKAGEAATSATAAASSASSASTAQAAAESARDATLAAYDNFDDRYLGVKVTPPTVDNDGNPLVAGSLYFSSTDGAMKVYTGTAWVAAYVSGSGTLLAANNLSDVSSVSSARTNLGLATVAATGAFSDLTGKPTLGTAAAQDTTAFASVVHTHIIGNVTGLQTALDGKQPIDADLTAIAGLTGTSGLLKKTAADTWTLDTTAYSTTTGTVTSVAGTGTVSGLSLSGTVTTSGSLTLGGTLAVTPANFASQTANYILAAPNGVAGTPTFRAIVAADIPTLNQNTTGTAANVTGTVAVAKGGTGATDAATARTNLGLAIGTNVQAWDADLDTWATKTAPSGAVVGTTDTQTLSGKTLTNPTVTGYTETVYALATSGSIALNPANGSVQTCAAAGTVTFTDSISAGQSVILMLTNGSSYTINYPTITWVTPNGNVQPALSAGNTLVFWKVGTTLYGAHVGKYA